MDEHQLVYRWTTTPSGVPDSMSISPPVAMCSFFLSRLWFAQTEGTGGARSPCYSLSSSDSVSAHHSYSLSMSPLPARQCAFTTK